jgi:oxygen-independent coproporphyrinogen-3 oxidase
MNLVLKDPNTTHEHLQKLYDLGFRRVSFGVQDYFWESSKSNSSFTIFHNVAKLRFGLEKSGILL